MARKHGFSGAGPPASNERTYPAAKRERLVRMAPPANDNRFRGLNFGRLRFTGFRLLIVAAVAVLGVLLASAAGVF